MPGVAIGIFVKRREKANLSNTGTVHHAHLWGPLYLEHAIIRSRVVEGNTHSAPIRWKNLED